MIGVESPVWCILVFERSINYCSGSPVDGPAIMELGKDKAKPEGLQDGMIPIDR